MSSTNKLICIQRHQRRWPSQQKEKRKWAQERNCRENDELTQRKVRKKSDVQKKGTRHKVNGNDFRRCAWAPKDRDRKVAEAVELWRHGTPSDNTVQAGGRLTNIVSGWGPNPVRNVH
ncbi:hypothetical protein CBL_10701 [Carabus blaptoides fortunei]